MDSDDDIELESEIAEMVAFETAALAALRAGDPDLAVQNADGTLRCPLCSPSKKKQSYAYRDLLAHATAVAVGIRGPEAAGKHSALKLYLESDLASLADKSTTERDRPALGVEVLSRRRDSENKLVCPWSVVLYRCTNSSPNAGEEDEQSYVGQGEIKKHFAEFNPGKVHMIWGPEGHLDFSVMQFGMGFEGLNDALALEKHFMDADRGQRDYERDLASGNMGAGFYGWLARREDLTGRPGKEGAAVAKYVKTYGDLKDIGMMVGEIKLMHDLQMKRLAESLAVKEMEALNLKTEVEVVKRKAEEERLQFNEALKTGTGTSCNIL